MARTVSIRRRLLRDIVLTIAILGAAIIATTYIGNRRTVEALSASLIERVADQTEVQLRNFFEPAVRQLRIAARWQQQGLLDSDDPAAINRLLVPIMQSSPQITSLMLADSRGREHMLLRLPDRWRSRQTRRDEWGDRVRWWEWTDEDPEAELSEEQTDYDPRSRPWFGGAVEKARALGEIQVPPLHWTQPYTFFATRDPGITASLSFRLGSEIDYVIGFDIMLNDISKFTTSDALHLSEAGLVVVVENETSNVLGLPRDPRFESEAGRRAWLRKPVEELAVPAITDALAARRAMQHAGEQPLRYQSGGQAWWVGVRPLDLGGGRHLRIAVLVPERDLIGGLDQLRLLMLGVVAAVLLAGIWRAMILAGGVSRPIEALVGESERIRQGDLEPGTPIESSLAEVQSLADAQQRMRVGLGSLMKLERDLQVARQIQQKTFPTSLPALAGFEVAGWSEPADETGGDTYDVIGLQGVRKRTSLVATESQADRAVMLLADATGHGIGPALSVTQLRAMLRMALRMGGDLADIARNLNEQLCDDLPPSRFITLWLGMLDADDSSLRTFSGGQAPLLHYRSASGDFEQLEADAPPFGILPELPIEIGAPRKLRSGDIYAVLSDGIYEARDPDATLFGEQRVMEIIRANASRTPQQILDAIRSGLQIFARGRPADDDQTAIIIKRR